MADFLKFINELTVNGKPVDEDDADDDYTAEPDGEEDDKPGLDLNPGSEAEEDTNTEEDEEPAVDDDYTAMIDDDDDTAEEPAADDADGKEPTGDDAGTEEPPADDTGGEEPALDLNPGEEDTPEPAAETEPEGEPAAEEPTGDDAGTEEPPDDDTGDIDTNPDDAGDTGDDAGNDDGSLDMGDDGGDAGDDDYTATDGEEDPGATDDDMGDGSTDDMSTDDSSGGGDSELEAKIKQTEAEIFNALSDDEKNIKNRQLIDNFVDLKKITKVFLEKVQTVTETDENSKILRFVEVSLLDLNNMITDYIITRYNKKSYIENFVTYQQFILTIEQLKEIVSKLNIDENPQK